jgi:hypothetical protein
LTQHLITQPAKPGNCTRCGALVIAAMSGGLTTVTDPESLTINQEIAARLTGRSIYDLSVIGRSVFLEWRDLTRIRAGRNYAVVAIHKCPPGGTPGIHPVPATTAAAPLPDTPPF